MASCKLRAKNEVSMSSRAQLKVTTQQSRSDIVQCSYCFVDEKRIAAGRQKLRIDLLICRLAVGQGPGSTMRSSIWGASSIKALSCAQLLVHKGIYSSG